MKILVSLIFFVFISAQCFAQTITFDKSLNFEIMQSELMPDEGYVVTGFNYTDMVVVRLSEEGFIVWMKVFQNCNSIMKRLALLIQSDGIFLSTNIIDSSYYYSRARLIKLDFNGNILFDKFYGSGLEREDGLQLTEADSGNYFFLSSKKLYKINSFGDIQFVKNIDIPYSAHSYLRNFIQKISDDFYLVLQNMSILGLDGNADTLWINDSYTSFLYPYFIKSMDNNALVFFKNKMIKINREGEIIKEVILKNSGFFRYALRKGNKIFLLYDIVAGSRYTRLITLDSDSIIVSEKILPLIAIQISPTNDDGFLISSSKNNYDWLMKTDSELYHKSVTLNYLRLKDWNYYYSDYGDLYPQVLGFQNYLITWEWSNVNKVNLDYSTDAGKSWTNIASNLSCDSAAYPPIGWNNFSYPYYVWTAPGIFNDKFFLRVSDSENPSIYDRTDPLGSLIIYQQYDTIAVNEILMWIGNNGMGSHNPRTNGSGFYWPGGDSATIAAIFADGLVWGGKVNGEIRVNGDTYRYGLQPGRVLENGEADNPLSTQSKIFKIRKDWQTLPEGIVKDRLEYDYTHWPVEAGAPWDDVNEDGVFTPGFDKIKFIGDETLFYVANDLDTAISRFTYGSDPIGLEFQTTVFGFNREDLKDVVFKKYKVINKSNADITDMYFTYWADVDMGNASDDFEGFDSTLNMGYCFNGDNNDEDYYGSPPPAIGHMIIQGPIIPASNTDSARYDTGWRYGYRNLGMTSSGLIFKGNYLQEYPGDPILGEYEGSLEFYNMMQGLNMDGSSIINPITGEPTIWPLSGDPVLDVGWYEGTGWPGGPSSDDRRYHVPSGPFTLAENDTQEVVYAILMAKGTDNINSITKLRELAAHVQEFYNTEFVEMLNTKQTIAPTGYTLFQNYPNPFNPKTTIEYEVPEKSFVTIKIYDILGREVQTLVNNEEKVRWRYKVVFDASTLASGVYFYRFQAGSFTQTKKMVVLK